MPDERTKLQFHFIKTNQYRDIRLDGAHGGVTPHGQIFAALYSERSPIPQVTVHPVNADGTLGDEIREERRGKQGIIRDVEVGLLMDLQAAQNFQKWLGDQITQLQKLIDDAHSQKSTVKQ